MRSLLLLVSVAAIGCGGPPDHYTVRIHPSVQHVDSILAAMEDWEQHTSVHFDGPVVVTSEGCQVQDCIYISEVPDGEVKFDGAMVNTCGDGHYMGCTNTAPDTWTSHIKIRRWAPPEYMRKIVMHELGHCFGLVHTPDGKPPSVMRPSYDEMADSVQEYDVIKYWQARH